MMQEKFGTKAQPQKVNLDFLEINDTFFKSGWCYAQLMENVDVGIIIFDLLNERIISQNNAALKLFKGSVKPKDFHSFKRLFFPHLNPHANGKMQMPDAGELNYGSLSLEYSLHPLEGGYLGLFVSDSTQKTRRDQKAKTLEYLESIDSIFFGIRQEIGSPVMRIKDVLQSVRSGINKYSQQQILAKLDQAISDTCQIDRLLTSLQDFSNCDHITTRPVEMVSFLKHFVSIVTAKFKRNGIELISILPEEKLYAKIDTGYMKQALFNLFANAINALEGRNNPQVIVSLFENDRLIHLQIEDNGIGIPDSLKSKIFQPFYSSRNNATGLGLAQTRKILAKLNGSIKIDSIHNVGTLVCLSLPAIRLRAN